MNNNEVFDNLEATEKAALQYELRINKELQQYKRAILALLEFLYVHFGDFTAKEYTKKLNRMNRKDIYFQLKRIYIRLGLPTKDLEVIGEIDEIFVDQTTKLLGHFERKSNQIFSAMFDKVANVATGTILGTLGLAIANSIKFDDLFPKKEKYVFEVAPWVEDHLQDFIKKNEKPEIQQEFLNYVSDLLESVKKFSERATVSQTVKIHSEATALILEGEGYEEYDLVTEPNACPICEAVKAQNPHKLKDRQYGVNFPYIHDNCRCGIKPRK